MLAAYNVAGIGAHMHPSALCTVWVPTYLVQNRYQDDGNPSSAKVTAHL